MTKEQTLDRLMQEYPRSFRRSSDGKKCRQWFDQVISRTNTYFWPDKGIEVVKTDSNNFTINKRNPIYGLLPGQGIIICD